MTEAASVVPGREIDRHLARTFLVFYLDMGSMALREGNTAEALRLLKLASNSLNWLGLLGGANDPLTEQVRALEDACDIALTDPQRECPTCKGEGQLVTTRLPGGTYRETCPSCGGQGVL